MSAVMPRFEAAMQAVAASMVRDKKLNVRGAWKINAWLRMPSLRARIEELATLELVH